MRWQTGTRISHFKDTILPKYGITWAGSPEEFIEFLAEIIAYLPEQESQALQRFYFDGETQERNDQTGRPTTADSRFYLAAMSGRVAAITAIKLYQQGGSAILGRLYGSK